MDRLTHEVFDQDFATVSSGYYRALCGMVITAAPMFEPEGSRCEACAAACEPARPRPAPRLRLARRTA